MNSITPFYLCDLKSPLTRKEKYNAHETHAAIAQRHFYVTMNYATRLRYLKDNGTHHLDKLDEKLLWLSG